MMTLYHGSYVRVPAPLTGVGRRELDFGPGFYVTPKTISKIRKEITFGKD